MRRGGEHGGIAPLMAGLMIVLVTILVGASAVGRLAMLRADAQRGADSACLLAANVMRQEGFPFSQKKKRDVSDLALRNLGAGARIDIVATDTADHVELLCKVDIDVEVPWGTEVVHAQAMGSAAQHKYDNALEVKPRFVLVLDFSGSMGDPMVGDPGGRSSLTVLKDSVRTLFEMNLPVKYGGVIYSTGVTSVAIGPDAPAQIRQKMSPGPNGVTATAAALNEAGKLLAAAPLDYEDQASYVLLVSDGQPNDGSSSLQQSETNARNAAKALRDGPYRVYIHTLHIVNQQTAAGRQVVRAFMEAITGDYEKSPDIEGGFHAASSDAALKDEFEKIAGAVACPVQLEALPEPGTKLYPFLRAPSMDEVVLKDLLEEKPDAVKGDLNSTQYTYRTRNMYFLDVPKKRMFVTKAVCDKMLKANHIIVLRYQKPRLTE